MSSRFEGLPMALLEAMACGVPCISFDCPYGPAEIITPEEDGILVKNGNTDELADAICRLIEDTDKRIRMGKQAQKNIQRYLREEVMKLWDELFNTLTTTRISSTSFSTDYPLTAASVKRSCIRLKALKHVDTG